MNNKNEPGSSELKRNVVRKNKKSVNDEIVLPC